MIRMTQQSKQLFWKFSNAFTKELRDTVIKGMDNGNLRPAETVKRDLGKDELTATEDKDIRKCNQWAYEHRPVKDLRLHMHGCWNKPMVGGLPHG